MPNCNSSSKVSRNDSQLKNDNSSSAVNHSDRCSSEKSSAGEKSSTKLLTIPVGGISLSSTTNESLSSSNKSSSFNILWKVNVKGKLTFPSKEGIKDSWSKLEKGLANIFSMKGTAHREAKRDYSEHRAKKVVGRSSSVGSVSEKNKKKVKQMKKKANSYCDLLDDPS